MCLSFILTCSRNLVKIKRTRNYFQQIDTDNVMANTIELINTQFQNNMTPHTYIRVDETIVCTP